MTADSVVVQSGHILLVTRKFMPGEGLLALPGGFIKEYELIVDAVIRELKEETKLKVPIPVLKGSIKEIRVFDAPYRSQRGRTITHAAYIHLQDATELPKVTARDDAKYAAWYELGTLQRNNMFEDHYDIIDEMVNL